MGPCSSERAAGNRVHPRGRAPPPVTYRCEKRRPRRGPGLARRTGAAAPSPSSLRRVPGANAGEPNVRGNQSTGAISTIRSAFTPPGAVKSSDRFGERKALRQCLDPRETLLFLCLKSPASCHLAPVSSLFSHTCSSSRSRCPGHVSKKKKKSGGCGRGRRDVEKHTPTPISRKKKKKKSGLILDPLDPGSWRPREVGVSARRGASNEKMSGRRRSFTNCTPASPTASSPPLLEPFPRFPPPLSPHRLASDCLTRDGEEQVSLPERSPSVCPSLPQALLGSSPAGRRRDSVPRAGCRMCLRGYRASRSVAAPGSG